MATIGSVTKRDDGRYEGELRTLSVRAEILSLPVAEKASPSQPDYRVMSQGIEIGAGWIRTGQTLRQGVHRTLDRCARARLANASTPTSAGPQARPIPTSSR